jgi:DNA-binding MarR family transcriptional regulator
MPSPADEFMDLFPAVYLRFCRRHDGRGPRLTPQMAAVLQHLSLSGPLTIGEMAQHLDRAQSVVSEIVDGLESKGLLARMRDARDRRRTLVWLTDEAHDVMHEDRQVLDRRRVDAAMKAIGGARARELVEGMRALVAASGGRNDHSTHRSTKGGHS